MKGGGGGGGKAPNPKPSTLNPGSRFDFIFQDSPEARKEAVCGLGGFSRLRALRASGAQKASALRFSGQGGDLLV